MSVVIQEMMDVSLRDLQGMKWVDANYDGKITSVDPVWNRLGTGDIVQTVDTMVNGQNVNVSYTYNPDGTRTAHVNTINGKPPLDQAANDVGWRKTA